MNRIDRLMGIVTTLQAKKFASAEFIAEKYGISLRTVYRDIKALGEIGIPISFEQYKGYFIVHGYFLPPVSFTAEEANALILMEAITAKFGDHSIRQHYEQAMHKIKAVLRPTEKEKIDHLQSQIKVYTAPGEDNKAGYLSVIQQAITGRQILLIAYRNNNGEESSRETEPIGLTFYGDNWHMIAWCHKRKAYRDFKIAHIQSLKNTMQPFTKGMHIDINQYILSLE
jgi:predicted DNA-binding transcriptional regulator YafY